MIQVAPQFPVFNISDVTGTSNGGDSLHTVSAAQRVVALLASVSHQWRKHSLKFGADWRRLHFNEGAE